MIILASASPRRKEILSQAGIDFKIVPSEYDESQLEYTNLNDYSKKLSYNKAIDVFQKHPLDTIIASDTIVTINNQILGKPKDKLDAFRMLKMLQGNKHAVVTSVCIMNKDKTINFLSKSYVYFYKMTNKEINEYIDSNEPMDKAGAYAIQGKAAKHIKSIHGDYYTIVGLPIARLLRELKRFKI